MSIAALVRSLAAAGATPEVIAIAVDALETEQAREAARKAKRAEQKASERARKKDVSRDCRATVAIMSRDPSPLNDPQPLLPNVEVNLRTPPKEKDTSYPKRKTLPWPVGSFDRIWAAYPNKVGKKVAFAKLAKIEREEEATPDEIIAGIERYKLDKPEHHEWKHPLTWLNGGCWLDEYAAPVATGPPVNGRPVQDFGARADKINAILEKRKADRDAIRH